MAILHDRHVYLGTNLRLDTWLGVGRMEKPMKAVKGYKSEHYLKYNIRSLLSTAERRVEVLKLRKEIIDIDAKLEALNLCFSVYPPQKADTNDEAQPSAVHDAPTL
jgi:hypothetical protein